MTAGQPLAVGSPEARALHGLMTGQRIVHANCDRDGVLDLVAAVVVRLHRAAPDEPFSLLTTSNERAAKVAVEIHERTQLLPGGRDLMGHSELGGLLTDGRRPTGPRPPLGNFAVVSGSLRRFRVAPNKLPTTSLLIAGLDDQPWRGLQSQMRWGTAVAALERGEAAKANRYGKQILVVGPPHAWHYQLSNMLTGPDHPYTDRPWGEVPVEIFLAGAPA